MRRVKGMCARFTLTAPPKQLETLFHFPIPNIEPRFNIAPTQDVLSILHDRSGAHAEMLRWGLIPSWAKEPSIGSRLVNARVETVTEKPAFRGTFQKRRCLVPAS